MIKTYTLNEKYIDKRAFDIIIKFFKLTSEMMSITGKARICSGGLVLILVSYTLNSLIRCCILFLVAMSS